MSNYADSLIKNLNLHTSTQLSTVNFTEKLSLLGETFRCARNSMTTAMKTMITTAPPIPALPSTTGLIKGKLDVCIVEAKNLSIAKADLAALYCVLNYNGTKHQTPDHTAIGHRPGADSLSMQLWAACPKWQHTISLDITAEKEQIDIQIFDRSTQQCLGVIKWKPALGNQNTDSWHRLHSSLTEEKFAGGEIRIQLNYTPLRCNSLKPLDFHVLRPLGHGSFGKVYLAEKKDTKQVYAMKVLSKRQLVQENQVDHTLAERNVLIQAMNSPFIVSMKCCFQTPTHLFLVMDYLPGGDLFGYLQQCRVMKEDAARLLIAQLICALEALHQNHIMYRDLKPENILIDSHGHVTLTDFGLCKQLQTTKCTTSTFCGTSEYLAPEMILMHQSSRPGAYTEAIDWWELGILLYEVLVGDVPFHAARLDVLYRRILNQAIVYPPRISSDAKNLIQQLLQRDPVARLASARSIKKHPFFRGVQWQLVAKKKSQPPCPPLTTAARKSTTKAINIKTNSIPRNYTIESFLLKNTPHTSVPGENMFEGFSYILDQGLMHSNFHQNEDDDDDDWEDI
ncbi:kinase-like domain-containing protein [Gongronella butleri]|nr:kinase-like domain-containing protein [Gongronella butleri]